MGNAAGLAIAEWQASAAAKWAVYMHHTYCSSERESLFNQCLLAAGGIYGQPKTI
jgi:hypothetical protein